MTEVDYQKLYEAAKLLHDTCKDSVSSCSECVFGKYSGECGLCRFPDDWELIAPDSAVKLVKE